MIGDAPSVWWEAITGPRRFASDVVVALKATNFVVLQLPADYPWRQQTRFSAALQFQDYYEDASLIQIDCAEEFPDQEGDCPNVARYLLSSSYVDKKIKNGYRESSGQSIQSYMIKHKVLQDRVIWVKGMRQGQENKWLEFCKKYKSRGIKDGLFVIEVFSNKKIALPKDVFTVLRYDDYVSGYDALLFDSMLVSDMGEKDEWLQYVAIMTSSLCGRDVELSCRLIEECDFSTKEPVDALLELAEMPEFSQRAYCQNLPKRHPFSIFRHEGKKGLDRLVWKAQLQSLLPLIESERLSLIDNYYEEINTAINAPFKSKAENGSYVMKHDGTRIDDPIEVELGTIAFMLQKKRFDNSRALFEFPNEKDLEHFSMLHEMRNNLAHMNVCSSREVALFYSTYPYSW